MAGVSDSDKHSSLFLKSVNFN